MRSGRQALEREEKKQKDRQKDRWRQQEAQENIDLPIAL